jgi:hypothetical protein
MKFDRIQRVSQDEFGDDAKQPTYTHKPIVEGKIRKKFSGHTITPTNIPVEYFGELVYVLLKDFQGKHFKTDVDEKSFLFPYARYLKPGAEVKNVTTGEIYHVEEMIMNNSSRGMDGHHVRLKIDGEAPLPNHRLRLSEDQGQLVNLTESFPDGDAKGYEFGEDGHLVPSNQVWVDTVTYQVLETAPTKTTGGAGSSTGIRNIRPQFREEIQGVDGKHESAVVFGQLLSSEVRFDCWSRSNNGSTNLRHWFRTFMHHYTWVFGYNGFTKLHMLGMGIPAKATKWRTDIVAKSVSYFFLSQDNWVEELGHIRDISFEVKIPSAVEEIEKQPQSIHTETVTITGS